MPTKFGVKSSPQSTEKKNSKLFLMTAEALGIPSPKMEYQFLRTRKFRFDFAWLDHKLAVEIEGGVWISGRHTRGHGYISDMEKYNLATKDGWRVLRFTPKQIKELETYEMIKECLSITK
jgi:very-short-patch-repair endonuclease